MPLYPQGVAFPLGNIPQSHRNILGRNGGMEVWQRGAGGTAAIIIAGGSAGYTADGWWLSTGSAQAAAIQVFPGLVSQSRYSAIVRRIAGQTGVGAIVFECPLDTDEITLARGQIVTLSVVLMAGAGFSPAGSIVNVRFYTGTGAPAKRTSGAYTSEAVLIDTTQAVSTTATRYSFTTSVIVPTATTQASVWFSWTPVGTASTDDLYIDDVQLEVGSVATPFERRPFESELLACMRHYEKTCQYSIAPAQGTGTAVGALFTNRGYAANTICSSHWHFKVTKRVTPTVITYNPSAANANYRNGGGTGDYTVNPSNTSEQRIALETTASVALNDLGYIHAAADAGI
jgi:hypothetical protein